MSSQPPPIHVRSLSKAFGDRTAVDDLSFDVPAGTITGFVGANGAGKTTTMRMLLGLVTPTAGTAEVHGRRYRDLRDPRREVGAVVDGPGAHPRHSARTHLTVMAMAAALPLVRVDQVLDLVGLADSADRPAGGFSMGMLQRLALAGALLGDPRVLILDEPVNGLDPPGILWIRDLLRRLAAEGRALLVSSHLLSELAEVVDRVVIIDHGHLVIDSTLEALLAEQAPVVEVRCAHPAALRRELSARGLTVTASGDALVVDGIGAPEVGEIAATVGAGPVHWLSQRSSSFEDAYFRLAPSTSGRPELARSAVAS